MTRILEFTLYGRRYTLIKSNSKTEYRIESLDRRGDDLLPVVETLAEVAYNRILESDHYHTEYEFWVAMGGSVGHIVKILIPKPAETCAERDI